MAPVTIATNARGWYESGTTIFWTAHCLHDTGTALYAVIMDTSASPGIEIWKANSRTNPTSWTQHGATLTVSAATLPYSSWLDGSGRIHLVLFTSTNTIAHRLFDTGTDAYISNFGQITTAAQNERSIRVVVRSDGDVLVFFTSSADDADLGYFVWQGADWATGSVTAINAASSAEAANIIDAGIDSTDRAWVVYTVAGGVSTVYRTINSANTVATNVTMSAVAGSETAHMPGARYTLYDDAGTDKIVGALFITGIALSERVVTLEADSASGNLAAAVAVEGTSGDVGARTPASTAVIGGVPYAAWWDEASSGTLKYSTKSGGAWATETNHATSITNLIETVPLTSGDGLAVVYQSGTSVVFDWIVAPSAGGGATGTATVGTATAAGGTHTGTAVISTTGTHTVGTAPAAGGTHTGTAGASATGTTTVGPATATGGAHTASAGAIGTATVGTAPAAGGLHTGLGVANATGTATVGTATAAGGSHIGSAVITETGTHTASDAAAAGGSHTGSAAAISTATVGDATATGGTHTGTADSIVHETGTATAGDATATGHDLTGEAGTTGATTTGEATATGNTHTASVLQEAWAIADVSVGDWSREDGSTTDLYESINELAVDDADYIRSPLSPVSPSAVRLQIGGLDEPTVRTGHIITYRYSKDAAGTIQLTARLYQGAATLIETDEPVSVSSEWVTRQWELSPTNAAGITDYTDLRIEFEAEAM